MLLEYLLIAVLLQVSFPILSFAFPASISTHFPRSWFDQVQPALNPPYLVAIDEQSGQAFFLVSCLEFKDTGADIRHIFLIEAGTQPKTVQELEKGLVGLQGDTSLVGAGGASCVYAGFTAVFAK
ncbi:hypothetical protein C8J57DRAFT_1249560 [Mycena rebaudengoi]|nr:hypothetical protein C8J57DRAFT_1249560 [Mycena rebaudengoi]